MSEKNTYSKVRKKVLHNMPLGYGAQFVELYQDMMEKSADILKDVTEKTVEKYKKDAIKRAKETVPSGKMNIVTGKYRYEDSKGKLRYGKRYEDRGGKTWIGNIDPKEVVHGYWDSMGYEGPMEEAKRRSHKFRRMYGLQFSLIVDQQGYKELNHLPERLALVYVMAVVEGYKEVAELIIKRFKQRVRTGDGKDGQTMHRGDATGELMNSMGYRINVKQKNKVFGVNLAFLTSCQYFDFVEYGFGPHASKGERKDFHIPITRVAQWVNSKPDLRQALLADTYRHGDNSNWENRFIGKLFALQKSIDAKPHPGKYYFTLAMTDYIDTGRLDGIIENWFKRLWSKKYEEGDYEYQVSKIKNEIFIKREERRGGGMKDKSIEQIRRIYKERTSVKAKEVKYKSVVRPIARRRRVKKAKPDYITKKEDYIKEVRKVGLKLNPRIRSDMMISRDRVDKRDRAKKKYIKERKKKFGG